MSGTKTDSVRRWSTADVPQTERLEYYAAALSEAVVPFSVDDADRQTFHNEVRFAELGTLAVTTTMGAAHRSFRGRSEFARTNGHSFNLLMTLKGSWTAEHRSAVRLAPRDILIHDTELPLVTEVRQSYAAVNVAVSEGWLRHWVSNPQVLSARHISGQTPWGYALTSFLAGLSPELVAAPPVPLSVLSDQVGSLLALIASGFRARSNSEYSPAVRSLHARILDCIQQRCTESQLTATDVSVYLNISVRTVHRTLAAANQTFGCVLIKARVSVAERMLASALFNRVTTAEIGRRAGFTSASHFARVMRARTGRTPLQLRHAASGSAELEQTPKSDAFEQDDEYSLRGARAPRADVPSDPA